MTKELARYFLTLIDKDLYFSFNGMGLPNSACEWLENQLMQENFDKVEEFIKLRYTEQSEKAIKKKRKFRAITNGEICRKWKEIHIFCRKDDVKCPFYGVIDCRLSSFKKKPFQTKDGKYVLIEVKE